MASDVSPSERNQSRDLVPFPERYCDFHAPGATGCLQPVPPEHWRTSRQWHPAQSGSAFLETALTVALTVALSAFATARAAEPPDPSVRLFDTVRPLDSALLRKALSEKTGWVAVAEADPAHAFTGDAVVMNDRCALVLRRGYPVAEVYAAGREGYDSRAMLRPWQQSAQWDPASLAVLENGPGAVTVQGAFASQGRAPALCGFRLTAGEPIVEVRPGDGMRGLGVFLMARQVLVPDFFGDDMAFDTGAVKGKPMALPAENVILGPTAGGNALVMCVWESAVDGIHLMPSAAAAAPGEPPAGAAAQPLSVLRVGCTPGKRVWLACLEGDGLWQAAAASAERPPAAALRGFKPPMPAKWRADFVGLGGVCESVTFEQPPDAAPVPETWRGPVLIYPIDRSRTTPLTALLPIDVLRSTLGVGPCQYILALEGLASDEPPTPAAVTEWVEKQFKRKRGAAPAEEIKARLDAMLNHLTVARARIADYAAFGGQVRGMCQGAATEPAAAEDAKALLAICDRLDHDVARGRKEMKTREEAAGLAREIVALAGAPDAAAKCGPPAAALCDIGHAQDATLARARMAARRVREHCRTSETEFARKVQALAEGMLRKR